MVRDKSVGDGVCRGTLSSVCTYTLLSLKKIKTTVYNIWVSSVIFPSGSSIHGPIRLRLAQFQSGQRGRRVDPVNIIGAGVVVGRLADAARPRLDPCKPQWLLSVDAVHVFIASRLSGLIDGFEFIVVVETGLECTAAVIAVSSFRFGSQRELLR